MTGNYFVATTHRVVASEERYSSAYFHGPGLTTPLAALPLDERSPSPSRQRAPPRCRVHGPPRRAPRRRARHHVGAGRTLGESLEPLHPSYPDRWPATIPTCWSGTLTVTSSRGGGVDVARGVDDAVGLELGELGVGELAALGEHLRVCCAEPRRRPRTPMVGAVGAERCGGDARAGLHLHEHAAFLGPRRLRELLDGADLRHEEAEQLEARLRAWGSRGPGDQVGRSATPRRVTSQVRPGRRRWRRRSRPVAGRVAHERDVGAVGDAEDRVVPRVGDAGPSYPARSVVVHSSV